MEKEAAKKLERNGRTTDCDPSDEGLMLRYTDGDARAFDILLSRHKRAVYGYICRLVGHEKADDLFQETFFRVVKGRSGFQAKSKFSTWLFRIAHNACVDYLRKAGRAQIVSLSQPLGYDPSSEEELLDTLQSTDPGPAEIMYKKELESIMADLIENVPAEQRAVLLLRENGNLPFQEIANIVGCTVNTAKSRMRYALESIRKGLASRNMLREEPRA